MTEPKHVSVLQGDKKQKKKMKKLEREMKKLDIELCSDDDMVFDDVVFARDSQTGKLHTQAFRAIYRE